ncbi:UNVERIFIED_CONTAM: hypothetical protein Scaly_0442800 [Sesamum calycinum]|uniref:Uncharacterized protein n=1 Tax=Sesamum calycinum TaxID=2727403 RepID=A0AAW2SEG3_9LAMI
MRQGAGRRYGTMATYDEAAEAAKHGHDAAKKGVDAAKRGGQQVKKEATAAADNAGQKMGDMAGKVSSTAQDAAGKVKQTAQDAAGKVKQTAEDAWGSVKDATSKIKDTVVARRRRPLTLRKTPSEKELPKLIAPSTPKNEHITVPLHIPCSVTRVVDLDCFGFCLNFQE